MTQDTNKYKRLWLYLKPYWKLQALTGLVMIILTGLTLALPAAIQYMIDTLIPNMLASEVRPIDYKPVLIFGAVLMGIYLFEVIFGWFRDYLTAFIGVEIIKDIRMQLFSHMQKLSLGFFSGQKIGEIMSRLLSDVGRLQDLLTSTLLMLFTNVLMLIGILSYLLYTHWLLTLIAIIPVPLTVLTTKKFGSRLNVLMSDVQQRMADLSAKLQESLLSIKTIKAYRQEEREAQGVDQILTELNPVMVKASVTSSLGINLAQFINMVGPIIVLAWGVYMVVTGELRLGELIAFYILLTYLYSPVRGLAETHIQVQSAMASADRIFEYLDIEPKIKEPAYPINPEKVYGNIQIQNIHFSYGTPNFRFQDLSLSIRKNETVALVGPSGSGKTTIINLLMRFFDPQEGQILIDNVNLKDFSLKSLRKVIALVEQDPFIFRMTVKENISYGYPDATDEAIINAAKAANIHDFIINLPHGYDTELGERGVTVSGGERQRLCLARAILMDPPILILDEATSSLDANSEQLIQKSLESILKDKTAIIIAHRLATVQYVDRIIAMENGTIIDQGTHSELFDRCDLYRELAQKQMLH